MFGPEPEQGVERLLRNAEHLAQIVGAGVAEGDVEPEETPAPEQLRDAISLFAVETFDDLGHGTARLRLSEDDYGGFMEPTLKARPGETLVLTSA